MNHKTKDRCQLKFLPYSYFSKEVARKVSKAAPQGPRGPERGEVQAYARVPLSTGNRSGE